MFIVFWGSFTSAHSVSKFVTVKMYTEGLSSAEMLIKRGKRTEIRSGVCF